MASLKGVAEQDGPIGRHHDGSWHRLRLHRQPLPGDEGGQPFRSNYHAKASAEACAYHCRMLRTYIDFLQNSFFPWAWKAEAEAKGHLSRRTVEAAAQALGYTSEFMLGALSDAREFLGFGGVQDADTSGQVAEAGSPRATSADAQISTADFMGDDPVFAPLVSTKSSSGAVQQTRVNAFDVPKHFA